MCSLLMVCLPPGAGTWCAHPHSCRPTSAPGAHRGRSENVKSLPTPPPAAPDTFAIAKSIPGDQLLAFMLGSSEAEEGVGSQVRWTRSSFRELLCCNYEASSPLNRAPTRTELHRTATLGPGFLLGRRHGSALCLRPPGSQSQAGVPCRSCPSLHVFSLFSIPLPWSDFLKRGRVLCPFDHVCILEPSAQPSLYRAALTSPSFPGPETLLDKHLLSSTGSHFPGPAAAPTSLRPSHLSGTWGPNSPDCVME